MIRKLCILVWISAAIAGRPAAAGIVTISPTGTTGPGGTITFAEIGQNDNTFANVNTDFTALGAIPITATVIDNTPFSVYGNDVNDTGATWTRFTATAVNATFLDPNDPNGSYSTYTDTQRASGGMDWRRS